MRKTARDMEQSLAESLKLVMREKHRLAIPVSPNRRLDAGAIGSLVADYPLQLFPAADERIMDTADFLMKNCLHKGGFFQDMIHSGINAYLTLMLAQTHLRAGDPRLLQIVVRGCRIRQPHRPVAGGHPSANRRRLHGGRPARLGRRRMGDADAQHVCAWRRRDRLVIGRGICREWLQAGVEAAFGPTLTPYGAIRVTVRCDEDGIEAAISADWYNESVRPEITVQIPGWKERQLVAPSYSCRLERR